MCQHYALSSYALTCARLKYVDTAPGDGGNGRRPRGGGLARC